MARARDNGLGVEQEIEQGFVTNTGRFVDRVAGLAIAKSAGQIVEKHGSERILFSEDMW